MTERGHRKTHTRYRWRETLTHSKTVIAALKRCATLNRSFFAAAEVVPFPHIIY